MSKKKKKNFNCCDYELPPTDFNCGCGNNDLALNLKYFAQLTNEFTKAALFYIRLKHGAWLNFTNQDFNYHEFYNKYNFTQQISLN